MTITRSGASLIALALLASCSGGGSSSAPMTSTVPGAPGPVSAQSARTGSIAVTTDLRTLASNHRSPKFIGSGVNGVAYQFYSTAGSTVSQPAGSVSLASCSSGSCTINIPSIPAGSYGGLLLSLVDSAATPSTVGSGFAVIPSDTANATTGTDSYAPILTPATLTGVNAATYQFSITAGGTTSLADAFAPVNSAPAIAFSSDASSTPNLFFVDGTNTAQIVTVGANETDPAGNTITTADGPVADYPTLTLARGDSAVTIPTATVATAPSSVSGTALAVDYTGTTTPSGANETLTLGDGSTTTTATIPFVSIAAVPVVGGTGGYSAPDVDVNDAQTVQLTVTEANAYFVGSNGTPNRDALKSTTTCSSGGAFPSTVTDDDANTLSTTPTTTPFDGNTGNMGGGHTTPPTSGSPSGIVTYTVTGDTGATASTGSCTLTIASATDANLKLVFTIAANAGNLTIPSTSLIRKH
jgi:hypothetical protein